MKGPLPFIVAVTGHTDIPAGDFDPIAARVRALLLQLRDLHLHTQIELLTPLAEGADRLAARVAIELGIPIIAPLPLPPDEYKKDFADAASRDEFDALLAQALRWFVLPRPTGGELRPECYVNAGAFIVQHCHLLLALWDGVQSNKRGGTSDIVRFCLEGPDPQYARYSRMLDPKDRGLVHHIVTPRLGAPREDAYQTHWLMAGGGGEKAAYAALGQMAGCTNNFNRLALDTSGGAAVRRRECEGHLIGTAGALPPSLQRTVSLFGVADELAIRYQSRTKLAIKALFIVGFGAVVAFEAATENMPQAIVPYLLLLVLAYSLFRWVNSRGFDNKHLDYRSLAEALRVQFYWRLAGIRSSVAEHYMRYHLKESEWIRNAILAVDLHDDAVTPENIIEPPATGLDTAIADWVRGQNAFFTRAEQRDHRLNGTIRKHAGILAFVSLIGILAFMLLSALGRYETEDTRVEWEQHLIVLGIAVFAAAAAAMHGYTEKRALEAQTKRYSRMRGIFQSAIRILERPDRDPDQAREVLRELGKEALEENADWVMLHRDRPIEPPTHG